MEILLKVIHVLASIFLVLVVLLQSGRGGGMGAAFGGASSQIFGGRGASTFLSRVTSGAAMVFFMTSLTLSIMSSRHRSVVMDALPKTPASAPGDANSTAAQDANAPATPTGTQDEAVKAGEAPADGKGEGAKKPNAPAETPPGVPEPAPAKH